MRGGQCSERESIGGRKGVRLHCSRVAMREMSVYGVSFDVVHKQPIVLLKTSDANRYLPIWIGHPEAAAILMKLQGNEPPRPLTHDLVTAMLGTLDAEIIRVTVTELRDNTFYAVITLQRDGQEIDVDSAHRTRSPSPSAPTRRSTPQTT